MATVPLAGWVIAVMVQGVAVGRRCRWPARRSALARGVFDDGGGVVDRVRGVVDAGHGDVHGGGVGAARAVGDGVGEGVGADVVRGRGVGEPVPLPVLATVPLVGGVTAVMVRVSPSGSVSLASTLIGLAGGVLGQVPVSFDGDRGVVGVRGDDVDADRGGCRCARDGSADWTDRGSGGVVSSMTSTVN